jgi:hypothetical protein
MNLLASQASHLSSSIAIHSITTLQANGDSVSLSLDYKSHADASGGPLSPGTVHFFRQSVTLDDDIGSHACSLEALACVRPIPFLSVFSPLTGWHCTIHPNTEGDVGKIIKDDDSSKPFKVEFGSKTWWYRPLSAPTYPAITPSAIFYLFALEVPG